MGTRSGRGRGLRAPALRAERLESVEGGRSSTAVAPVIPLGLFAKLGGPALKYGGMALAAIGLVIAALWYVRSVRQEGYAAGKAETEVQVITNTVIVKERIQRAEDRAPRNPAGVSQRLREGTF